MIPKSKEQEIGDQLKMTVTYATVIEGFYGSYGVYLYEIQDENGDDWYTIQIGNGPYSPATDSWSQAKGLAEWCQEHQKWEASPDA